MTRPVLTLAASWAEIEIRLRADADMGEEEREVYRVAYYTGAAATIALLTDGAVVDALRQEIRDEAKAAREAWERADRE